MRYYAMLTAALLATATFDADAQQRYRWVDENGSIRISDRIPPDAADKRVEVLNARGMVIRVIEPKVELTAEQAAARDRDLAAAAQAEADREAQAHRDRMLLDSYTTVEDLTRSRDNRVSALEAQILVSRDALAAHEQHLLELDAQAERVRAAGNPVPDELTARIADTQAKLEATAEFVETRVAEQQEIRAQFDADIARFQELRGSGRR